MKTAFQARLDGKNIYEKSSNRIDDQLKKLLKKFMRTYYKTIINAISRKEMFSDKIIREVSIITNSSGVDVKVATPISDENGPAVQ